MTLCQSFVQDEWVQGISFRSILRDSRRDIDIILRLYYLRHSFSWADLWLTNPLARLGFMSLQQINKGANPQEHHDLCSSLSLALVGLDAQGGHYYIARTVYYIIKNQVPSKELGLFQGKEDPQIAADDSPELIKEIQSAWIVRISDISDTRTAEDLSTLAARFLTLDPRLD